MGIGAWGRGGSVGRALVTWPGSWGRPCCTGCCCREDVSAAVLCRCRPLPQQTVTQTGARLTAIGPLRNSVLQPVTGTKHSSSLTWTGCCLYPCCAALGPRFLASWAAARASGFPAYRAMVVARSRQHVLWYVSELRRLLQDHSTAQKAQHGPGEKRLGGCGCAGNSGCGSGCGSGCSAGGDLESLLRGGRRHGVVAGSA